MISRAFCCLLLLAVPLSAAPRHGEPIRLQAPHITLLFVPAGTFTMGADPADPLAYPAEQNRTRVTISRPFWLGETEITREQWEAVMGPITGRTFAAPRQRKGEPAPPEEPLPGNLPMVDVTWADALAFCDRLTERERHRLPEGYVFSLPTEAQWEYACRAGREGVVPASPEARNAEAWSMENTGPWTQQQPPRLKPVATRQPNPWGFYDMLGNVREWVLDALAPYPGGEVTDPLTTVTVPPRPEFVYPLRVMRGGAWLDNRRAVHACARDWADPTRYAHPPKEEEADDFRAGVVGFRIALVPKALRDAVNLSELR